MKSHFKDVLSEIDENILLADGFDEAIVGYIERAGSSNTIACYDKNKCIEILAKDMTHEEAVEYFYFNTVGAYMGEYTPCFITTIGEVENEIPF